ncbi:MAG: hypothetical protein H6R20_993 [Proteobacteria bacterium]|jgi:hypothetical protein|nr:hypothetical protein [Pseudomonadota bacterium]
MIRAVTKSTLAAHAVPRVVAAGSALGGTAAAMPARSPEAPMRDACRRAGDDPDPLVGVAAYGKAPEPSEAMLQN